MNERKDYLYLSNPEVDLTQDEIIYDFREKGAAMDYCSQLARSKAEVFLLDAKYQREAVITDFNDGVARFTLKSLNKED